MQKAVAICGQICSGKSSVISHLSKSYAWDIISFGKYIRQLAVAQGLPSSRKVYQILGQEVLDKRGPRQFLLDVIHFNQPDSVVHLFDGIRHISILNMLRQIYDHTFIVYLDLDDDQRFYRFQRRAAEDDLSLTYEEFLKLSDQPVEKDIPEIAYAADLSIDASSSLQQITAEIEKALINKGFIG